MLGGHSERPTKFIFSIAEDRHDSHTALVERCATRLRVEPVHFDRCRQNSGQHIPQGIEIAAGGHKTSPACCTIDHIMKIGFALDCVAIEDEFGRHILNTPNRTCSGIGASRHTPSANPSTSRVWTGSITPSSHRRAVA